MVKHLLSGILFSALSLAASAQTFAPKAVGGLKLDKQTILGPQVKKTPAKANLANNQRLVGYYVSDEAGKGGVGIGSYCTGTIIPGALLEQETDYAPYIGAKVVGVRFYLPTSTAFGVVIYNASGQYLEKLVEKDSTITTTGWNTVMLDEADQFTLTEEMVGLMVGTKVNQTASNYPVGVNPNVSGRTMYIYCNIPSTYGGSGEGWYNFGDDYALTIQLLLESDNFPTNAASPKYFGKFTVELGKTKEIPISLFNTGTSLKNVSYTISQDGVTSEEKTVNVDEELGVGGTTKVTIPFSAADKGGMYPVTVNIIKVNGQSNEASTTTATGKNITLEKILPKFSVVEEFTGVTCGWCPRGHLGMAKLRKEFGDKFIGVALHGYTTQTTKDAMYISDQQPYLGFSGAPSCMINRDGNYMDPYYGSDDDICNDFTASLEVLPEVGVTALGFWNEDSTTVTVKADFEALTTDTYETAYYLVADSLHGTSAAWKQYNYYASAYSSQTGISKSDLTGTDFEFLWTAGTTYAANFNDVMIASSYKSTVNTTYGTLLSSENLADNVELTYGQTTQGTYTMSLPTRAALKNAINKENVYVVALVIDPETGEVVNAAKGKIWFSDPAGITDCATDATNAEVVARYTANGQQVSAPVKGLNILKLANGKTVKVMVK